MINIAQMSLILQSLPDPAFLLSRTGKYVAVFGGLVSRYYHDGSSLVGCYISEFVEPEKANWFLETIGEALATGRVVIKEYELRNQDVSGLPDQGPSEPIWLEARVQ